MNYGYQNEIDFVNYFNNKHYEDFDNNGKLFLNELFNIKIDNNEVIKSWKNKANQKADIFIKYKNYVKGISLKCGNSNSIHHEQIEEFKRYLGNIGIPYSVIDYYTSYHYGYLRDENDKVIYDKKLSSDEYKKYYQSEINIFNNYINKTKIIVDMVDRFIIRGRNSDFDIAALICGTINDYVWLLKYDIYDLVLSKSSIEFTSPHIACMTLGPQKRLLNTSNNVKDKYLVCARWNFLKEDIINFKKNL